MITSDALNSFPCGLFQPAGAYRFGADALLLGAFASHVSREILRQQHRVIRAAELGCGCGAAMFSFCLLTRNVNGIGLEKEIELMRAARYNAMLLCLGHQLQFMQCDLCDLKETRTALKSLAGTIQLVMANPPWHGNDSGRLSANALRRSALHGNVLAAFCRTARQLLGWHGYFCLIIPPWLLGDVCVVFAQCHFGLKTILPLCPHVGEAANRLLIMARKEAAARPIMLPMLVLHDSMGAFSENALDFCPWLAKKVVINSHEVDTARFFPPGARKARICALRWPLCE